MVALNIIVLLIAFCISVVSAMTDAVACDSDVVTDVCLPRTYSSMDIPLTMEPNKIYVELHINDILRVNDRDFTVTFSLYFNVQWKEPRLKLTPSFFRDNINSTVYDKSQLFPVDLSLINDLWVPNVFIYNLKTFSVIDVLSKLAGLWVSPNKDVMYSQASQITFICPMIFNYFPLDTQVCNFQVGSYSYNMEKMIFDVAHLGYAHTSRTIVLDYNITIGPLPVSERIFVGGSLGNFSLAGFQMVLRRHLSHYIITYYLPSGLFVVVSWISFLVPPDIIPGRMALLVTLFLVLVNIFNSVTTNTPKADGLTAIEAWMLACILFVFGALMEYSFLLFKKWDEEPVSEDQSHIFGPVDLDKVSLNIEDFSSCHEKATQTSSSQHHHARHSLVSGVPFVELLPLAERESAIRAENVSKKAKDRQRKRRVRFGKVDKFFLVAFPVMFLIFNVLYWSFYYISPNTII